MTTTIRRVALGVGAGLIALGVTAGVYAAAQNTNQDPRPFSGRGGPGGPGRFGGPGGPMGMLPMLGPQLNLTDAQKDQIKSLAASHKDEWQALATRARTAQTALRAAVTADAVDESLIRQKSLDAASVDADMAVARAHAYAEVLQILTADQRAQLKTMEASMTNRMRPHQQGRRQGLLEHFGL